MHDRLSSSRLPPQALIVLTRPRHHDSIISLRVFRIEPLGRGVLSPINDVVSIEDQLRIPDLVVGAGSLRLKEPVTVDILVLGQLKPSTDKLTSTVLRLHGGKLVSAGKTPWQAYRCIAQKQREADGALCHLRRVMRGWSVVRW